MFFDIPTSASRNDAEEMIDYLDPILKSYQDRVDKQVAAVEKIASESRSQSQSAEQNVAILREQLEFAKQQAKDAKRDAKIASLISVISLIFSGIILYADYIHPWIMNIT